MQNIKTEIVVVGAGVIGSAMALMLAMGGMECVLIDKDMAAGEEAPSKDPRALALTLASQKILRFINAWQPLNPSATGAFKRMHVWDGHGRAEVNFNCDAINQPALGHIVRQTSLTSAIQSAQQSHPSLTMLAGASPVYVSSGRREITLRLSDGRSITGKLIIAADGVRSQIRELIGIDYDVHRYKQTALASMVNTEIAHGCVARQRFMHSGPIAFLPMFDPHQCAVIWSTTPEQADTLAHLEADAFHRRLEDVFESRLGPVHGSGPRACFPLQRAQARYYCTDRVALIGDAAHCVHPLAGLGANLGLLDAASLFEVLSDARLLQRDLGSRRVLRRYERWRKGENFMVMMILEGFKYVFENQTSPVPEIRNAGMGMFNAISAWKRFIMRRATGLTGDLPDMVRAHAS